MQCSYGLKHLTVMAEDAKVRVVRFAPNAGDKTPLHSHPSYVVYVVKGGRVKYTLPDGSTTISELKTGQVSAEAAGHAFRRGDRLGGNHHR